jgi:hypothetical protein
MTHAQSDALACLAHRTGKSGHGDGLASSQTVHTTQLKTSNATDSEDIKTRRIFAIRSTDEAAYSHCDRDFQTPFRTGIVH